MKRALAGCAVLLGTTAVLWGATRYAGRPAPRSAAPVPAEKPVTLRFFREPAALPAFSVDALDGRTLSPALSAGRVTIVNFWATWCPPCRAEIPDLVALQQKYPDRLQIIGISEDEGSLPAVKAFVAEHHINYPVAMATPQLERIFPGVTSLPTSFILDRDGRVVQKHVGMLNAVLTEQETRALAGLDTSVKIERVDPDQPVGLENAAQAKEIPGVDLTQLPAERRAEALQRLNAEPCTCGCGLTVAKCRIDDPTCGVSLPIARKIVDEIVRYHTENGRK